MSAALTRRAALPGAVASVAMVDVAVAGAAAVAPTASGWERAKSAYLAAKHAEDWHDQHVTMPFYGGDYTKLFPQHLMDECDRLAEVRYAAKDRLMDTPSPHAAAFAFKYLVAHGSGRETDTWDKMLEAEAQRFASAEVSA